MSARIVALSCLLCLLVAFTPAAAADSVGASRVRVSVEAVAGLDQVTVTAGTPESALNLTPGTPRVCVSVQRSVTRTEGDVEVLEDRWEHGCDEGTGYTFDRQGWRATATGTIPTTLSTSVYERGPDGWHLVDWQTTPASAEVSLTWEGTGEEAVAPWVHSPGICYTSPPSVCYVGGGAAITRDAEVVGTVVLGGLDAAADLTSGVGGTMRWWASAGPLSVP